MAKNPRNNKKKWKFGWWHIIKRIFKEEKQPNHDEVMKQKDEVMMENIYDGDTVHKTAKKFHNIHFKFKYRFLVPLLLLGDKILGKCKTRKIPNKPWNKNYKIFDEAFEKSLDDWCYKFLSQIYGWSPKYSAKFRKNDRAIVLLTSMKEWLYTITLTDTAYRELFNILMHNIAKNMLKNHSDNPAHVFYRSKNCYNPIYFNIWRLLADGTAELQLAKGRDQLLKKQKAKKRSSACAVEDAVTSKSKGK